MENVLTKENLQKAMVYGLLVGAGYLLAKKLPTVKVPHKKATGMRFPPIVHEPSALNFDAPPSDPTVAFKTWFDAAKEVTTVPNPNAMSVATVDASGQPSVRLVLCRGFDSNGVVFYTNRESRKGEALKANPTACANFHWDQLDRQIRIEGSVVHTSEEESDKYWESRNRENRINSYASQQSRPVGSRDELEGAASAVEKRFEGQEIPRPNHWGGFRIALDRVEFWQGHHHRLHDRIIYERQGDGTYKITRLYP
jgi:pyridoxamine 5'-phosphate oxidase